MGKRGNKKQILNKYSKVEDLYKYFNTNDNNEVLEKTFNLLDKEIDNYHNKVDSKKILIGLNLISEVVEKNEDIKIPVVQNKLSSLYKKIDNNINGRGNIYATKDFKKVRYSVEELSNIIKVLDDNTMNEYDLVEYIIFETKNHYYLKNVFHFLKDSVNAKDENNKSIAFNTIDRLLDLVNENELEEEMYYLDKVVDIIFSSKRFKFDEEEKLDCLSKIYNTLLNLKNHDKLYNNKKNLIINLKDTIQNGMAYKNNMKKLEKKYNIKRGFSREILKEVIPDPNYQNKIPKVLLNDYIISIDGKRAMEIDDAQSCELLDNGNYLLGFHNASVSLYYDYNSKIVQNAIERGENIYGRRMITIFPKEFSGDRGSLLQGLPRMANSHFIEISPSGDIVDQYLAKSIIINRNRTTYQKVGDIIVNGSKNKKLENTVNNLVEVAKIIAKRYNQDIYVDYNKPEEYANQMVLFPTLLHNEEVANFFYNNNYPMIYRVQDEINIENPQLEEKIKEYCKYHPVNDKDNMISKILYYDEGSYYATKGSHAGLKIDHYTHFSSLLRRSADIVAERAVDAFYFNFLSDKEKYNFEDNLESTIKTINRQIENIKRFKEAKRNQKVKRRF